MDDLLAKISRETSPAGAIEFGRLEVAATGAVAGTFHMTTPHASQVSDRVYISEFGQDDDWLNNYLNPAVRKDDPIPDFVMRMAQPVLIKDVIAQIVATPEQQACIDRFYSKWPERTMAFQAYGPFDFDSYVSITMPDAAMLNDPRIVQRLAGIIELTNRRVGQLIEGATALSITLSPRENEVLQWIGRSKSNADIATILDVSAGTVDTYVRRLYAKFQVNDRISAVVKGIRIGLIRY